MSVASTLWNGYARMVVALRWIIVLGWAAAAVAATLLLPPLNANADDLEALGARRQLRGRAPLP